MIIKRTKPKGHHAYLVSINKLTFTWLRRFRQPKSPFRHPRLLTLSHLYVFNGYSLGFERITCQITHISLAPLFIFTYWNNIWVCIYYTRCVWLFLIKETFEIIAKWILPTIQILWWHTIVCAPYVLSHFFPCSMWTDFSTFPRHKQASLL